MGVFIAAVFILAIRLGGIYEHLPWSSIHSKLCIFIYSIQLCSEAVCVISFIKLFSCPPINYDVINAILPSIMCC